MKKYLVSQFGNPRGPIGYLAGKIMARRNVERNRWVVDLLGIEPNHDVLEIGFGPGLAVQAAATRIVTGNFLGIDHSTVMLRQATRRNADTIESGKVRLIRSSVQDMDLRPRSFDRIYAINVTMFWRDPIAQIRRIRALLKHNGRLAIAVQPRWTTNLETVAARVAGNLQEGGFAEIESFSKDLDPVGCVCVVGSTGGSSAAVSDSGQVRGPRSRF